MLQFLCTHNESNKIASQSGDTFGCTSTACSGIAGGARRNEPGPSGQDSPG